MTHPFSPEGNGNNGYLDGSEKPDFSNKFLVTGIGASAGGIQALSEFFTNVPADSGIAYVVILHLSPDHDSQLANVLQHVTTIPVRQVTEKTKLEPDHVYVVPPDKSLVMADGHIVVKPIKTVEERRAPVDIFFRTLAESHGPNAAGVVLSGTGADGSMGLKRIKETGGATFVQNPREASFNGMPRSAIATELVDSILPVADIPRQIISYRDRRRSISIPDEPKDRHEEQQNALRDIFSQLRVRTGHDFSNYKRPTMLRRIERRISVRGLADIQSYAAYLRETPEESNALLKDLLISVTNFFRDRKAFNSLEKNVVTPLLEDRPAERPLRVWVAGCATGEEAYSIAIMVVERTSATGAPPVQIFATDIDEQAIAIARNGLYTLNDAADVSPERLRRFFTKEGESYRVRREIREMVLFARHNLLTDPPFSHLDLVTCRNLLIYLNSTAQERAMETFHFALNPGGYLFIGSSESIDGSGDLFAAVDKESHVFQSRHAISRHFPVPETIPIYRPVPTSEERTRSHEGQLERVTYNELHLRLLEEFAPPSIVVNADYEIVHLSERAGAYLQVGGGEPTNNLLHLVRQDIRVELRGALYQALQQKTNVEVKGIELANGDRPEAINLLVRPVLGNTDTARGYILVIFEPVHDQERSQADYVAPEPVAMQLEEELVRSRVQLHSALEQAEIQSEELRASNEELQSMNEELRSSAEELETSKEELQSINEELTTVNQELKIKIEELSHTNNNFQNLLGSIDIGVLFLDRGLRVNLYSPSARDIFNLLPSDIGRPLSDITNKLSYRDLHLDADQVLEKLHTLEREVETGDGRVFMMRILPYRTAEDRIDGVVIALVDITRRKRAENRLLGAVSIETVGVIFFDLDGKINEANEAFEKMSGFSREDFDKGRVRWDKLTPPEFMEVTLKAREEFVTRGVNTPYEKQYIRPDGSRWWGLFAGRRLSENECVEFVLDISERKRGEAALRASEERMRLLMDSFSDIALFTTDTSTIVTAWNPGSEKIFGFAAAEMIGKKSADIIFTPEDRANGVPEQEREGAVKNGSATDERWHLRKDGSRFFASGFMVPLSDGEKLIGFGKIASDLTDRKRFEERLQDARDELEKSVDVRTKELAASNESLRHEMADRQRAEEERIELLRKIVTTQEDERRRIARDLHDQMGQRLTALRLQIASLKENLDGNEAVAEQLEKLEKLGARIDSEVNFLAWELRPTVLDDLGLVTAAQNFVREWAAHFGVRAEFHSTGLKSKRLDSEIETNLYRITQEALNNVLKHAQANNVNVLLELRKKEVVLIVEDDGVGFDVEKQRLDRRHGSAMGLLGMHERAAIAGGKLEIESGSGKGTTVFARIPARFAPATNGDAK